MWLVELDIFEPSSEQTLLTTLDSLGLTYRTFRGHDFRNDPLLMNDATVCRGSCWFIAQISETSHWNSSLWGRPDDFRCSVYRQRWRPWLLNGEVEFWPLVELAWKYDAIWSHFADEHDRIFLRPNDGFKSFTGSLVSRDDFAEWYAARQAFYLPGTTSIVVARPATIFAEYRCFVSDGQVIAASRYRPSISSHVPPDVVEWVEKIHSESREPSRVYAADVAETEVGLKVVEIGCVPCLDFYDADVRTLIAELNRRASESTI